MLLPDQSRGFPPRSQRVLEPMANPLSAPGEYFAKMKNDSLTILRQSRFVAQAGEPMAIQGETLRPLSRVAKP